MREEIWQEYFMGLLVFSNNSWSIGQNASPPNRRLGTPLALPIG